MKNFIILIIFSLGLSLYAGSDLFPFGMNHGLSDKQYSLDDDEEYREKYKITMDLSAQAGIKWWRAQNAFRWYHIQPDNQNTWNFDTEDSLVKWCKEKALHLLPEIGFTADWARHDDTYYSLGKGQSRQYPPDPDYWDEYEKYIDTLVKRYKEDIKYWQFSNEPDGGGHTGFLGTPEQYIEMFEHTETALKTADPNAKIVGFEMCTPKDVFEWEYFDANSHSINDSNFGYVRWEDAIRGLTDSINPDNIDVISQHLYLGAQSFKKRFDSLRFIIGDDKPIWITEVGYQNSSTFKAERGTDDNCGPTSCVRYTSDSGEVFQDTVWIKRDNDPCYDSVDTFLNIGDSVVLYKSDSQRDTIIYNGGPLIYKGTETALALYDDLTIFDYWAGETQKHNRYEQDTSYVELLNMIINTQLENLKIFFFCAENNINRQYYPPQIRFGSQPIQYLKQLKHNHWSVIDTNNNPYPAYWTTRNHILSPRTPVIQDTTIEIGGTKTYQAESGITVADFTIEGNGAYGGKVAMEAGVQIYLMDGFKVEEGGYFYAATNPRYREGGGVSSAKSISMPKKAKTSEKSVSDKENIPKVFSCNQNFPNPFASSTLIKYGLPKDVDVKLEIFNLAGQKIHTLIDGKQSAGYKQIMWNGKAAGGEQLPQGIYFYTLKAGEEFEKKYKMVLLK